MTFAGVYVPLITPFERNGEIAFDALHRLAHEILDAGAAGLVALGTTAEPGSLSTAERARARDTIAAVCRDRHAQLIVGAGGDPHGADAVLSLVPPFVRPGEDGVVAYFEDLAARTPVPLIVYHIPYRTGQPLSAGTLRRLAALDNVAGLKLATGGIDTTTVELLSDPPPGFAILAGDDAYLAPLLSMGAHGGILASAHIDTAAHVRLARTGERDLGRSLARRSLALFAEPNPTVTKAVLHAHGRIPSPHVRLPLLPAAPSTLDAALAA